MYLYRQLVTKKSAEFWAEIEVSKPLFAPSGLPLEENDEEAVDGQDDHDVPVELFVSGVNKVDLPTGYKSVGEPFTRRPKR